MIGTLIRTAIVRTARSSRPIVVPVTRTSVRHSGGHGQWVYRQATEPDPYDCKMAEVIMTVMWWWFFYHIITEPEQITVLHAKSIEADLAESPVTGAAIVHVRKCTQLEKLTFSSVPSDNSLCETSLLETVRCFHNLRWLELSGVSAVTDTVLAAIAEQNKLLTVLKLNECVNFGDGGLKALGRNCRFLQCVDFSSTQITTRGLDALANSPCRHTIEEFLANRCSKLEAKAVEILMTNFPSLRILSLEDCRQILFGQQRSRACGKMSPAKVPWVHTLGGREGIAASPCFYQQGFFICPSIVNTAFVMDTLVNEQIKRKAQPLESLPVEDNVSVECHEDTKSMNTQTTNNDHQRASRYLSTISRLRSQVSYHRSKGNGALTEETFQALLFTTQSTVETTRFLLQEGVSYVLTKKLNSDPIEALFGRIRQMCGGNDQLDARAVTAALDRIVKAKSLCPKEAETPDVDAEQVAATLSEKFHDELEDLTQCHAPTPRSVTYSGLS
ncbi:hypothetical protein HPB52_020274 [Rhipicephalus sanguineus]|uniref:Uncharacterized protein n=1 Tax=Rhipicephalus sanguineus TaxID=34632 RepID=A0A9D4SRA5_RHISA|nr:hypothetical protein HPB52_020274 [Rhipicephalus sanguineus]